MRQYLAATVLASVVLASASPALAATDPLQKKVDQMTRSGVAGALLSVREPDGTVRTWTSGTAERGTGRPMVGADARFRIASNTKIVVAAAVMRLVAEGRVDLGAPVETYAPGLLDGRPITVRQLLTHTSGLPEYLDLVDPKGPLDDRTFLRLALDADPVGPGWSYANTNYLVAGMLIEKVTGQGFRSYTRQTVLRSLGDTYWPGKTETGIRGEHAHTYGVDPFNPASQGKKVVDTTQQPGYLFGASGGLISTPDDLNRFWQSLSPSTIKAMTARTVPAEDPPQGRQGLGIVQYPLSCGPVYMHGGGLPGVRSLSGRDRAGRAVTLYVTGVPRDEQALFSVFEAAMCR
ncbi:beta-lactamase family protein [Nonomuraea sp. NBC_01738]|uniref:serine hydrolase domain-containing protein n=1 Tax=Nonomuraea sp. NBC_01738 TaxID=2976003 RepID=UPI002E1133AD|nr:beta-lactamase family protein [Nonomuraea sp. NBC_01738]